ncbi:succinate dehydrogenase, hydrophobic membrane anchor protein [Candidatus Liberibacter americanus]|uniref:Succinate dehydrogenase hydrophobic membrane anchor subunit n=1 Tax=Candidatus Liberibacter americanus str. Sao Paulo TaxID=1261131 RepID=U6B8C9_9HYPH|nr:succinate dehydrogenase, hydrophobic membrane anchor protein [Candidatus Liberibacter americanus]AHA28121.1 Succinate dehydrogenase hydrophobic anchor subunit [Candidatus Liberibacter americanus str. Sao Paulo]EMS36032.1 succinate dehydrogenase, hydrophobic membrane anchor protein [Candidatus Liberibacter americanus PW_SP]
MSSSLGKVRGMGSAKDGSIHFLKQRVTAIANIPCVIFFIAFFIIYSSRPYEEIISAISNIFISSVMAIGFFSISVHMHLGMQTIIEDYIHSKFLKILLLLFNRFFVFCSFVLFLASIFKIVFVGKL